MLKDTDRPHDFVQIRIGSPYESAKETSIDCITRWYENVLGHYKLLQSKNIA